MKLPLQFELHVPMMLIQNPSKFALEALPSSSVHASYLLLPSVNAFFLSLKIVLKQNYQVFLQQTKVNVSSS
jgi:hypothetical protein